MGKLRSSDYQELKAATGKNPYMELLESWDNSTLKWSIIKNDVVIGVFGVTELLENKNIGIPWLLGSDEMLNIKKFFVKRCAKYIKQMSDRFPTLCNYVDKRNTASIRWLKWSGFEISPAEPFGFEGKPFHLIMLKR